MLWKTLHWRHNDHGGVSNHQPHGCLFNPLFRRRSKKTSKPRVTGLCAGNSPGPVKSPHKLPVTRKMFSFDDVIMIAIHHRYKDHCLDTDWIHKQFSWAHHDVIKWKHCPRYWPLRGEFTGPGESPAQRPVTQSFDVFYDLRPNKRLSKQSWGWWFETPSGSLWRHCNELNS